MEVDIGRYEKDRDEWKRDWMREEVGAKERKNEK